MYINNKLVEYFKYRIAFIYMNKVVDLVLVILDMSLEHTSVEIITETDLCGYTLKSYN